MRAKACSRWADSTNANGDRLKQLPFTGFCDVESARTCLFHKPIGDAEPMVATQ